MGEDDRIVVFITDGIIVQKVRTHLAEKTGLNIQAFLVKTIHEIPQKASGKTDCLLLSAYI